MAYPAYPTGDDLCQFLIGAGLVVPEQQDLDGAAEAGRDYFEAATDRLPMLAAPDTRLFDLPQVTDRGILDLSADLLSVTKLTVQGTEIVPGKYYLRPNDAANRRRPYNRIQLLMPYANYGASALPPQQYYQAISVEGVWGYAPEIPADAFRAMERAGALELVFGSVDAGPGSPPTPAFAKAWTAMSRSSVTYDSDFLWKQRKDWRETLDETITRYLRVGVG